MQSLDFIIIGIFAFIGAAWGSFSGVVIDRLFADKPGIFFGRSKCDHTGNLLRWWEMIPVFSYIGLGGKSARSGKKIPYWYLLLELTFGVVFGLFAYKFLPTLTNGEWLQTSIVLIFVFASLLLFFYDAKHFIVDRRISWPAIGMALIWAFFQPNFVDFIVGGAVGFVFYYLQWRVSKGKWVGQGDQELGLFMGLILGWKALLWGLLLSYILGTIISVGLIICKKNIGLKSAMPMGAFLMPVLIAFLLFPEKIWWLYDGYMQLNDQLIGFIVS